jgi:hypothetical protein
MSGAVSPVTRMYSWYVQGLHLCLYLRYLIIIVIIIVFDTYRILLLLLLLLLLIIIIIIIITVFLNYSKTRRLRTHKGCLFSAYKGF